MELAGAFAAGGNNLKHGLSKTRLHKEWRGILHRCKNQSASHYEYYGGKGITVCEQWVNNFVNFYNWAINNGYDDSLTLDRIDNNKGYSPYNCRWVTHKINCRNRGLRKGNKTGYTGVAERKIKSGVRYRAFIVIDNQNISLGHYDTIEEAYNARKKAEKYYNFKGGGAHVS